MTRHSLTVAATCALLALCASAGVAGATPTLSTFTTGVNASGQPLNVARGFDGDMWFTYAAGTGSVAHIGPTGTVTDLSGVVPADRRPYDIVMGPDSAMWFTETGVGRIGRIAADGTYTEYASGLSGGSAPRGIAVGGDGNLWFTLAKDPGGIGRITPQGAITVFTAGLTANGTPQDIASAPDNTLWFTMYGSSEVGRITPAGAISMHGAGLAFYHLPNTIIRGPEGAMWAAIDGLGAVIARINPANNAGTLFGGNTPQIDEPTGLAVGGDGNIWFVDEAKNTVGWLTPSGAISLLTTGPLPTLAPQGMAADASGNLWFVEKGAPARVWRVGIMPPTLDTATATVDGTAATVTLQLNGMGQTTDYLVRYGPTTAYGSLASGSVTARSSARQSANVSLSGLRASTTYQYRVTATNGSGTSPAVTGTFTTGAAAGTGGSGGSGGTGGTGGGGGTSDPGTGGTGGSGGTGETPAQGRTMLVDPVSGTVRVRLPGGHNDLPLAAVGGRIPMGAVLDATHGRVAVVTQLTGGTTQRAVFWGSRFTVRQAATGTGMTTIRTDRRPMTGCTTATASALATRRPPRRTLWGSDRGGMYRTQGRNSVATVRGTTWVTVETCTSTITRVVSGAVTVRDTRAKRTVRLRAGMRYVARGR